MNQISITLLIKPKLDELVPSETVCLLGSKSFTDPLLTWTSTLERPPLLTVSDAAYWSVPPSSS